MDSTLKSDLTVGPPIDFAIYKKDENKLASLKCLSLDDEDYSKVCNSGLREFLKYLIHFLDLIGKINYSTFQSV